MELWLLHYFIVNINDNVVLTDTLRSIFFVKTLIHQNLSLLAIRESQKLSKCQWLVMRVLRFLSVSKYLITNVKNSVASKVPNFYRPAVCFLVFHFFKQIRDSSWNLIVCLNSTFYTSPAISAPSFNLPHPESLKFPPSRFCCPIWPDRRFPTPNF